MGVDCSLLFGYESGIKEILLDRSYVFSRVEMNRWLKREDLAEQLLKDVDLNDHSSYSIYWLGYTRACVNHLYLNENVRYLAIVDEQQGIIEMLDDAKHKAGLKHETSKLIPFENA